HAITRPEIDAAQVAVWAGEAGDQTTADRVAADDEKNGDRRCCCLGRQSPLFCGRRDHGNLATNQIGGQLMQPIDLILGETVCDHYVLALDVACLLQALAECAQTITDGVGRPGVEKPNHRHRWLLRAISGHTAAPLSSVMNSRRFMVPSNRGLHPTTSLNEKVVRRSEILLLMSGSNPVFSRRIILCLLLF